MRKTATLLFLCAVMAVSAQADHYSDTYVIPVVGHVTGANGTLWMSDVSIRNFSAQPLNVEMILIESGHDTSDNIFPLITDDLNGSITVGPNSTVLLRDILGGYFGGANISGALILGGDRPFAVTSRAYSSSSPLGQTVPATRDFLANSLENADNTAFAYIPGVIHNASTRTNVGFVAGAGGATSMVVEVSVRNAAGGIVGTRSFFIPAGSFAHHQFNISSITQSTFDVGTVDVRITEGEGQVVPYASLIHNGTGEAAYIMGQFPDTTPDALRRTLFRNMLSPRLRDR